MNIYLTGMMGSGKTTIGKTLSKSIKYPFFDLDKKIEHYAGKSINKLFAQDGEKYFRKIESKILQKNIPRSIIACGGGIITIKTNCDYIMKNGTVIFLYTTIEQLSNRLKETTDRPLLNNGDLFQNLQNLWKSRIRLYNENSHLKVDTTNKSITEIINQIKKSLKL